MVAAAANLGVRLLDGDTLAPLPAGYLPHPDPITDVAFSPDGAFLLTAHESGSAQLWDVATRKPVGPPAVLIGPIRAVTFTPDGKTCVCVAADGTVRRWPVPAPFAEPDLARLADRVALMTGQRMDDNQGLDTVPADEWRALRAKLVGDGSTALVPPRPDADWHDAVAADAEQDGDAFGAEWHLDRLAALRPDDWTIPARRGRVLAAAGRRDEAAAAYDTAARLARSPRDAGRLAAGRRRGRRGGRPERQAALWNLDRAVALTPDDWTLYAARAALADQAGHPDRAAADMDEAIRRGAEPTVDRAGGRAGRAGRPPGDWKRAATLLTTRREGPAPPDRGPLPPGRRLPEGRRSPPATGPRAPGSRSGCRRSGRSCRSATRSPRRRRSPSGRTPPTTGPVPLAWIDHALTRLAEREKANPSQEGRNSAVCGTCS